MDAHRTFQVDLAGLVDLLSHHLYASPRVYVRELLQNAVDAITARRLREPGAPGSVELDTAGDGLRVTDSGVGLTEAQVHELLATIGRSSKRDDLGFARHEFLGQFGIGLLSCFLVAREIVVLTRAAGHAAVRWTGYDDGRYLVEKVDGEHPVGTTVTLLPRPGAKIWFAPATVLELARLYGDQLPVEVTVDGTPTTGPVVSAPWEVTSTRAWTAYAERTMGLTPFDVIPLSVPEAGLTGAAFVMPQPLNPAQRGGHRVYLKHMLLAESAEGLLPEWAFFARCVVDTSELRPTASREALYEDGLLDSTREALGDQLRGWLVRLARTDPRRLGEFLHVHHLGVKALALHDDVMLDLVASWWPMETNVGRMTLREFHERHGVIRYSATTDQFRQLAGIAAAQDLALVNAGYTYDAEIIERWAQVERDVRIERLDPTDLATRFETVDPATEVGLRGFTVAAQRALDRLGCEVVLRAFDPSTVPALYLIDRETTFRQELRATREKADPVWSDVLAALDDRRADTRPQLVLNHRNALVRRITVLPTADLVELAVEALYGQALLLGYHPIRPADAALLNRSFLGLLDRAVPTDPEAGP
ncbi:molecular chaperone HtpG [Asanoa ishikariensis]|uniref:Molecular chaperone HtpG n=1 Tax=Asanoa ishikariensis TaxID=137265 RepID=A0A1H3T2I5_9ACTN|nr:HSP90 family protein [Asanoa ishikariensis]SDZ43955.1 molecular chaperone HtpG [Asanoa ishikariensis]